MCGECILRTASCEQPEETKLQWRTWTLFEWILSNYSRIFYGLAKTWFNQGRCVVWNTWPSGSRHNKTLDLLGLSISQITPTMIKSYNRDGPLTPTKQICNAMFGAWLGSPDMTSGQVLVYSHREKSTLYQQYRLFTRGTNSGPAAMKYPCVRSSN